MGSEPHGRVRSLLTQLRGLPSRLWPRRPWARALLLAGISPVIIALIFFLYVYSGSYPAERLAHKAAPSLKVLDRNERLLREFSGDESRYYRWVPVTSLPTHVINCFLHSEDRSFRSHSGVSWGALLRAMKDNLAHGEVVSGASTITMQLARLLNPSRRTLGAKLREVVEAYRLERVLSKKEILEQYVNRLPFGHGAVGIEAAAWAYFKKRARDLSLAQIAFLVVIPRSPSWYDPRRSFGRVKRMQERLLTSMTGLPWLTSAERSAAMGEPIVLAPEGSPFDAPHFTRYLRRVHLPTLRREGTQGVVQIQSTLDAPLQRTIEGVVAQRLERLRSRRVSNAAVLVMDNQSGDVLAWVGSGAFSRTESHGQVDGVVALRQPGSALKPFTYALAMEHGYTAATVMDDVETNYSLGSGQSFTPRNYSGRMHGPVRLRNALASSLNIAAFHAARHVGYATLLERFKRFGFHSLAQDADHYGLGITMGNGEVRLLDLVTAYASLARGGELLEPRLFTSYTLQSGLRVDAPPRIPTRVLEQEVALLISDILKDPRARITGFGFSTPFNFPFEVAVKTGTSNNFRDNITVGYTKEVTVGVWVGNFDGTPMQNVSGVTGAGPIFREVMLEAMRGKTPAPFTAPTGSQHVEVCALSGMLPSSHCPHRVTEIFRRGHVPSKMCDWHRVRPIDTRNNLLASLSCGAAHVVKRVFAEYPARYASWIKEEGIITSPSTYSPLCPGFVTGMTAPRIVSPASGARYLIDPTADREHQMIAVRVEATKSGTMGVWLEGTRPVARVEWPYTLYWKLKEGTHTLRLRTGVLQSDPITIMVK